MIKPLLLLMTIALLDANIGSTGSVQSRSSDESVASANQLNRRETSKNENEVRQFGHANQWRSALQLDTDGKIYKCWESEIGEGRCQIVGDNKTIYVASAVRKPDQESDQVNIVTRLEAIRLSTGKMEWRFQSESTLPANQETFGGALPSPQSTPVIVGSRIISVSFTGDMICLNREDGKLLWEQDLVDDLSADPVQFGFSSSPVVDPRSENQILVFAAGKRGGLFNIDIRSGKIVWQGDCDSFSYATPVYADFGGVAQWIVVSQNEVIGFDYQDGTRLWTHDLTEKGLTNVPTPLVAGDGRLVISGQGCKGTRGLRVEKIENRWRVKELWYAKSLPYFYTNWLMLDEQIAIGCTSSFLAAFNTKSGEIVGRWRGYRDGNLLRAGTDLILIDGKGRLSLFSVSARNPSFSEGLVERARFQVIAGRCWTPGSIIGDKILLRAKNRLVCLSPKPKSKSDPFENLLEEKRVLKIERTQSSSVDSDPVEQVFAVFQAEGSKPAMALYDKLRANKKLDIESRFALAAAAEKQGLVEIAKRIRRHARQDFPDSAKWKSAHKKLRDK